MHMGCPLLPVSNKQPSPFHVPSPLSSLQNPDALVAAYESALAAGGPAVKLVVVDHVVSFPPLVLPVERICAACR
jgi:hypothetical protein